MPQTKKGGKSAPMTTPLPPLPVNQPEIHNHYYARPAYRFDFGKLSFGLFLIVVGLLYLAKNFGWLDISLDFNPLDLWPLLIIFIGLSLITNRTLVSIFAGAILTLTVLTITLLLILGAGDVDWQAVCPTDNTDNTEQNTTAPLDSYYTQPATTAPAE